MPIHRILYQFVFQFIHFTYISIGAKVRVITGLWCGSVAMVLWLHLLLTTINHTLLAQLGKKHSLEVS
jgi:hypothetical protein